MSLADVGAPRRRISGPRAGRGHDRAPEVREEPGRSWTPGGPSSSTAGTLP